MVPEPKGLSLHSQQPATLVSILSQMNPLHTSPANHLKKIHSDPVLPSVPRCSQVVSFLWVFPPKLRTLLVFVFYSIHEDRIF